MSTHVEQEEAVAAMLAERWEHAAKKIERLAEELPAEKFESRPVEGIRSPAEVLRHVAFWNQYVADTLRGKKAEDSQNELPAAEYKSKAKVLEVLRGTAKEAAAALKKQSSGKTAELVLPFIEHTSEHYGQLAVYARMMGVIPPASRG